CIAHPGSPRSGVIRILPGRYGVLGSAIRETTITASSIATLATIWTTTTSSHTFSRAASASTPASNIIASPAKAIPKSHMYRNEHPINQACTPCDSSWGYKGYNEVWLNGKNDWIYPHLHAAGLMIEDLAARYPAQKGSALRALNQAARELLLAQASDWAFMIS